jgi:excinuclease UvrABC ATPase subunit
MQTMLHYGKHNGWTITCGGCDGEGFIERHTATEFLGESVECDECEGSGRWDAELFDFDNLTVRLHNGIVVTVGADEFFDMDGNAIGVADVDDIAAVLESELV